MEYRAIINGVDCGMSVLASGTVNQPLFDEFGIGNACSAELSLTWYIDEEPPRASKIEVQARESSTDEWKPIGTYYLDVRDQVSKKMTVEAYDSMLKFETPFINTASVGEWPRSAPDVVAEMCERTGVSLDPSVVLDPDVMVEYPDDRTMREVLSSISAAHAGNWIISARDTLLMTTFSNDVALNVEKKVKSCKPKDVLPPVSGLLLYYDDENAFMAGNDTGYVLNAFCYFATQSMADSVLRKIQGYVYRGFEATAVPLPIEFQLGSNVTIDGTTYIIADRTFKFTPKMLSDVKAPSSSTTDHEYGIEGEYKKALKRRVQLGSKYYGVSISRQNGLLIEKTDSEVVEAKAVFNTDTIALYQGDIPVFYFDAIEKKFKMTASVDIAAVNDLQEQVNLKLDSNEISIAINNQLSEGVDGIKILEKDFSFNQLGLQISAGGGTTTTIDELGMEVQENGMTVLSARNNVVYAKNLNATTYLIVGESARFEKYGYNRIGCFWIGE